MKISVIIPAYRAAGTIGRAIDSVLQQTLSPHEIIVVDDGSPDDLESAVERFRDRVTFIRKQNGGASCARNRGIDECSGDAVAFLDADDYWEPLKLASQCEVLKLIPSVGLVAARWYDEDPGHTRRLSGLASIELCDRVLNARRENLIEIASSIWTSTVLVRRSALGSLRFETSLRTAEDRDLWIRIISSHPAWLCSEPLGTAVQEPGSLSRTNVHHDRSNMLRVIDKYRGLVGPGPARKSEALVYRSWAGELLGANKPGVAIRPALKRLSRQPWSVEGWWVLAKCAVCACATPRQSDSETEFGRQ